MNITVDAKGVIICPQCKKRTKVKIRPETKLRDFPLYCEWCKKETIIEV